MGPSVRPGVETGVDLEFVLFLRNTSHELMQTLPCALANGFEFRIAAESLRKAIAVLSAQGRHSSVSSLLANFTGLGWVLIARAAV